MATREQIAAAIAALSPEQRAQLESVLTQRRAVRTQRLAHTPTDSVTPENIEQVYSAAQRTRPRVDALSVGASPWYREPLPGTSVNTEDLAEFAPAAGATAGALATTKSPVIAGAAGGAAGEAARQMFRRAIGVKPATGIMQEMTGADPDSLGGAAVSIAGEAAAGGAGGVLDKILRWAGRASAHSADRTIVKRLLQPSTPVEKDEAVRLAGVATREGLVPAGSNRARQVALAEKALGEARTNSQALEQLGVQGGREVDAMPVLQAAIDEIPTNLPGGGPARTGGPVRTAATDAAEDVFDTIANTSQPGSTRVPLAASMSERRRLDDLLEVMYENGRENAPESRRAIKTSADAWRRAIAADYPELGAANLRQHDLITITKMMKRALKASERGASAIDAETAGAAVSGRMSIPFMDTFRTVAGLGPVASLNASGKRLLGRLLEGGANTAQLWVRAATMYGLDEDEDAIATAERHRRAQQALRRDAKGVVEP